MPGMPPPASGERQTLIEFLRFNQKSFFAHAYGLTDEQARSTPSVSALSVGGLIKHATGVQRGWMDRVEAAPEFPPKDERPLRLFAEADWDTPVPVPHDVPWFPQDIDNWTVRWVALHLIEELTRHAGHADIIRESVDGATMYELMAAVEEWPETDWIKRWKPRQDAAT